MKLFSKLSLLALLPLTAFASVSNASDKAPNWDAYMEAGGKFGTDRNIAELNFFMPIVQDDSSLLFMDLRGNYDDFNAREGNLGIGYRTILSSGWIVGGYGFVDHRRTPNFNNFVQGTLGIEALSEDWDLRANFYIPEASKQLVSAESSVATTTGTGFQVTTTGEVRERALPGFDAEVGYKLPFDDIDARVYGAVFHFDAANFDNLTGPRGRIEFTFDEVPLLPSQVSASLGMEVQWDDVRRTQGFAGGRIRVPLQALWGGDLDGSKPHLSALKQRMTRRIERDIDIVSNETAAVETVETASVTNGTGTAVTQFTTVDATVADFSTAITNAGANSIVVLDGSQGTINDNSVTTLAAGQMLVGGGTVLNATTASGKTASLTMPGSAATVNGTAGGVNVFSMAANAEIRDITVTGGSVGVDFVAGANDATLRNTTIQNTADDGIELNGANNVTISSVTITSPGGGAQDGIELRGTNTTLTMDNLTINTANSSFLLVTGTTTGASFSNTSFVTATNGVEVSAGATLTSPTGAITTTTVTNDCVSTGTVNTSTVTINGVVCN